MLEKIGKQDVKGEAKEYAKFVARIFKPIEILSYWLIMLRLNFLLYYSNF